jgi:hypothetical protein
MARCLATPPRKTIRLPARTRRDSRPRLSGRARVRTGRPLLSGRARVKTGPGSPPRTVFACWVEVPPSVRAERSSLPIAVTALPPTLDRIFVESPRLSRSCRTSRIGSILPGTARPGQPRAAVPTRVYWDDQGEDSTGSSRCYGHLPAELGRKVTATTRSTAEISVQQYEWFLF